MPRWAGSWAGLASRELRSGAISPRDHGPGIGLARGGRCHPCPGLSLAGEGRCWWNPGRNIAPGPLSIGPRGHHAGAIGQPNHYPLACRWHGGIGRRHPLPLAAIPRDAWVPRWRHDRRGGCLAGQLCQGRGIKVMTCPVNLLIKFQVQGLVESPPVGQSWVSHRPQGHHQARQDTNEMVRQIVTRSR